MGDKVRAPAASRHRAGAPSGSSPVPGLEQSRSSHGAWQPIETAPKDGTAILATAIGYEWPEVIRWEPYSPDVAEDLGEEGYWTFAEELLADIAHPEMDEIRFWMPLPEPPNG